MPYRQLDVYQKSYQLALELHKLTLGFPQLEQRELASQLRRSSKSIPANLAEGMGKQGSHKEVSRFIRIAIGSCDETTVWLDFSRDLDYLSKGEVASYIERYNEVGRMLRGLLKRYS